MHQGGSGNDSRDLVGLYRNLCERSDSMPDVFRFLFEHDIDSDETVVLELLLVDQSFRIQRRQDCLVEEYLRRLPMLRDDPFGQLQLVRGEFMARQHAGIPCDLKEYLGRFPELSDLLLEQISRFGIEDTEPPDANSTVAPDSEKDASDSSIPIAIGDPAKSLGLRFGSYRLIRKIGEGGMGAVFKAFDEKLERFVAIKMLRVGRGVRKRDIDRLLREARAIATLEHPSIVRVYELGESRSCPHFTMEFVSGTDLARMVSDHPLAPATACQYLIQACRAIAFAHSHGVLHRDLKPANLLVRADGILKVADFGLVKLLDSTNTQTGYETDSGQILGTPCYMSPEQARGTKELTVTADVYSLGATLYHLLVGKPPFQSAGLYETVRQIQESEPVPVRVVNPGVDRDLETICGKCLEKDPLKRYQDVTQLAEELESYLQNEPIRARPVGRVQRSIRWCRRNRAVTALGAILVVAVMTAGTLAVRWQHTRKIAAVNIYHSLLERVHVDLIRRAPGWRSRSLENLRTLGESRPSSVDSLKLRSLAAEVLAETDLSVQWCRDTNIGSANTPGDSDFPVMHALAFSPDGATVVTGNGLIHPGMPGQLHCVDVKSAAVTEILEIPKGTWNSLVDLVRFQKKDGVRCIAFSAEGECLAVGMRLGTVYLWKRTNGRWEFNETLHSSEEGEIQSLVFSRDANLLFAATTHCLDCWVRTETFQKRQTRVFEPTIESIHVDVTSGDLLVQAGGIHHLDRMTLESKSVDTLTANSGRSAFASQRSSIASEEDFMVVRHWDKSPHNSIQLPPRKISRNSSIKRLELSPHGDFLAVGNKDGCLGVWSVFENRLIFEDFIAREQTVPAFSPDGRLLAATGHNGVVLYSVDGQEVVTQLASTLATPKEMRVSPTGRYLAWVARSERAPVQQYSLTVWNLEENRESFTTSWNSGTSDVERFSLEWCPDESALNFAAVGGTSYQVRLAQPTTLATGPRVEGQIRHAADGSVWSISDKDLRHQKTPESEVAVVWSNQAGQLRAGKAELDLLEYSAGWCLTGSIDGTACLFDCRKEAAKLVHRWPQSDTWIPSGEVTAIALSDPPQAAALGAMRGYVDVISLEDRRPLLRGDLHAAPVTAIAFGDGMRLLATGSADGSLKLWVYTQGEYQLLFDSIDDTRRIEDLLFGKGLVLFVAREGQPAVERWDLAQLRKQFADMSIPWLD